MGVGADEDRSGEAQRAGVVNRILLLGVSSGEDAENAGGGLHRVGLLSLGGNLAFVIQHRIGAVGFQLCRGRGIVCLPYDKRFAGFGLRGWLPGIVRLLGKTYSVVQRRSYATIAAPDAGFGRFRCPRVRTGSARWACPAGARLPESRTAGDGGRASRPASGRPGVTDSDTSAEIFSRSRKFDYNAENGLNAGGWAMAGHTWHWNQQVPSKGWDEGSWHRGRLSAVHLSYQEPRGASS